MTKSQSKKPIFLNAKPKIKDTVGLFAPGFIFNKLKFEDGMNALKTQLNLNPVFRSDVFDHSGYFAGSDERRAKELLQYLMDPNCNGLIMIRGGYGSARIIPALEENLKELKKISPKIVMGYSDLTPILHWLYQKLGWVVFHGPSVDGRVFRDPLLPELTSINGHLFSARPAPDVKLPEAKVIREGTVTGKISGGCLSLLCTSMGTKYEVELDDHILFIEDLGERPYRLDRMITQLVQAGKLDNIKGIIIGNLKNCDPQSMAEFGGHSPDAITAIGDALKPILQKKSIPIIAEFPAGHGAIQICLPFGVEAELHAQHGNSYLKYLESSCKEPAKQETVKKDGA